MAVRERRSGRPPKRASVRILRDLFRQLRPMTQKEIAAALGCSRSALPMYLYGYTATPESWLGKFIALLREKGITTYTDGKGVEHELSVELFKRLASIEVGEW